MHVYVDYIDRPLQGIALTRSPSLPPVRSFWFRHIHPGLALAQWVGYTMLRPPPRTAYAAAASLPPTATKRVTGLTYWRRSAYVVCSPQRYSTCHVNLVVYVSEENADVVRSYVRQSPVDSCTYSERGRRRRCPRTGTVTTRTGPTLQCKHAMIDLGTENSTACGAQAEQFLS